MSKTKTEAGNEDAVEIYTRFLFIHDRKSTMKLFMDPKLHSVHFTLPAKHSLLVRLELCSTFHSHPSAYEAPQELEKSFVFTVTNFPRASNPQETARLRNKSDKLWQADGGVISVFTSINMALNPRPTRRLHTIDIWEGPFSDGGPSCPVGCVQHFRPPSIKCQ